MATINKCCLYIIPVCGKLGSPTPDQIFSDLLPVDGSTVCLPDDNVAQNRLNSPDEKLIPEREVYQHWSAISGNNR